MTRASGMRTRTGFTVIELIVSMTVLAIVLAGATMTLLVVQRQYTAQRSEVQSRETARSLELLLGRLFRNARANPRSMPAASLTMAVNPAGRPQWDNVELKADFNPVDATVNGSMENVRIGKSNDTIYARWTKTGAAEPLAYPVSKLLFQFYDVSGTELTTTAAAASARRVKVTVGVPVAKSSDVLERVTWYTIRNQ